MCSVFGVLDYGNVLNRKKKNKILNVLARECEVRGTDATGIAYNANGHLHVFKRPLAAHKLRLHVPADTRAILGHTRLTTQGNAKYNSNNHPWATDRFALAHNGILYNDMSLRFSEKLPQTNIRTDSYVAVQLLEQEPQIDFDSLQRLAEKVEGSFVFTILDKEDNLYFIRGNNPLAIWQYEGFYLYASTEDILQKTERQLRLKHRSAITSKEGDIVKIDSEGYTTKGWFLPHHSYAHWWREYPYYGSCLMDEPTNYDELFEIASAMGVSHTEIQSLLDFGCDTDEIEELLYDPSLLHETAAELMYGYA